MNVSCFISKASNSLSPYEQLCLYSFARKGYTVRLYTYNDAFTVPEYITLCSARDIIPEDQLFENVHEPGSYSMFSNLFRYRLLNQKETTWIDTDVLLVADRLPDRPYLFGWQDSSQINGAVLRIPPNSQLGKTLIDNCTGDPKDLYWGIWGPKLLTRVITELSLLGEACSVDMFYSVHWRDALATLSPSCTGSISSTLATANTIHLWNEMLRRQVSNYPLGLPPAGSYLHQLVQQWSMQSLFSGSISGAEVDRIYVGIISRASPFVTPLADRLVEARDIVAEEKHALSRELKDTSFRLETITNRASELQNELEALKSEQVRLVKQVGDTEVLAATTHLALQRALDKREKMAVRIGKLQAQKKTLRANVARLRKYSILRLIPAPLLSRLTKFCRETSADKRNDMTRSVEAS